MHKKSLASLLVIPALAAACATGPAKTNPNTVNWHEISCEERAIDAVKTVKIFETYPVNSEHWLGLYNKEDYSKRYVNCYAETLGSLTGGRHTITVGEYKGEDGSNYWQVTLKIGNQK